MDGKGLLWVMLMACTTCYAGQDCNPDMQCSPPCKEKEESCIDGMCMTLEAIAEQKIEPSEECPRGQKCNKAGICVKIPVIKLKSPTKKCKSENECDSVEYCDDSLEECQKKKNFDQSCYENKHCKTGICSSKEFEYRDHKSSEHQSNNDAGKCRACIEDRQCPDTHFCKNWDEEYNKAGVLLQCLPKKLYHNGKEINLNGHCASTTHDRKLKLTPCSDEDFKAQEDHCEGVYSDFQGDSVYQPECTVRLGVGKPCPRGRNTVCGSSICESGEAGSFCADTRNDPEFQVFE